MNNLSGGPWKAVKLQWFLLERNSIVLDYLLGLNVSIFKETFYVISRMPVNENRTTKAKHIYYQMSPVDHCYRENVSCRYSRGKVRNLFFLFHEKATIGIKIYVYLTSPSVNICEIFVKPYSSLIIISGIIDE